MSKIKRVTPKEYIEKHTGKRESPKEYIRRTQREWEQEVRGGLYTGNHPNTNRKIYITPEQLSTHMHIIGATGVGKSKFLEWLVRMFIDRGHGGCVIDPHGDLYEDLLRYCAHRDRYEEMASRVVLFNPAETKSIIGFNPIERNARTLGYQVVGLVEACRKVWGQETFQATPRLARWLYNIFYALIENNLTLYEAQHMINLLDDSYRRALTAKINEPIVQSDWEWFNEQSLRLQEERVESSVSRIRPFLLNEQIKLMLGQKKNALDFRALMDEGKILLVNLSTHQRAIRKDEADLLGTLLVNEIMTAAFARPEHQRKPFFLCIDEFARFAHRDICEILDGGRKFGLHLILAHQHLQQLEKEDTDVYFSTLTNARTKVVFGGLTVNDLETLGQEMFTFDIDERKLEIWHTVWDPVETTREVITESNGQVSHQGLAEAVMSGRVDMTGYTMRVGDGLLGLGTTDDARTKVRSTGSTSATTRTTTTGDSDVSNRSLAVVPWYEYHPRQQLASVTFRSLEEQLYRVVAMLKNQPQRYAVIKTPEGRAIPFETPFVKDPYLNQREVLEFIEKVFEVQRCYTSKELVEREIAQRQEIIEVEYEVIDVKSSPKRLNKALTSSSKGPRDGEIEPKSFRESKRERRDFLKD